MIVPLLICGFVLLYATAIFAFQARCIRRSASLLEDRKQEAKSSGCSTDLHFSSDLRALRLYQEVALEIREGPSAKIQALQMKGPDVPVPDFTQFAPVMKLLEKFQAATELPVLALDLEVLQRTNADFSWLAEVRQAAMIAGARSISLARLGGRNAALEDVRTILGASRHLGEVPLTIFLLVRIACLTVALETAQRLARRSTSAENLESLKVLLREHFGDIKFREVLAGEIGFACLMAEARPLKYTREDFKKLKGWELKMRRADARLFMNFLPQKLLRRAFLSASIRKSLDLLAAYSEAEPLSSRDKFWQIEGQYFRSSDPSDHPGADFVSTPFTQALEATTNIRCRLNAVLAYIDILRYRINLGGFPEKLETVSPAAIDLFSPDGDLLRYHRTASGFEIYTVGPANRDGGHASPRWMLNLPNPGIVHADYERPQLLPK